MKPSQDLFFINTKDLMRAEFWVGTSFSRKLHNYVRSFWLDCELNKFNMSSLTPELTFSDQRKIVLKFSISNFVWVWNICFLDLEHAPCWWKRDPVKVSCQNIKHWTRGTGSSDSEILPQRWPHLPYILCKKTTVNHPVDLRLIDWMEYD